MLRLRDQQLEVLREAARRSFVRFLATELIRELPALCRLHGKDGLLSLLDAAVGRALEWGIGDAAGQTFIARLVLAHGLDLDESLPWTAPLLSSTSLDGASKVALLAGRLPARLRPEVLASAEASRP